MISVILFLFDAVDTYEFIRVSDLSYGEWLICLDNKLRVEDQGKYKGFYFALWCTFYDMISDMVYLA